MVQFEIGVLAAGEPFIPVGAIIKYHPTSASAAR
jgi:hypothetical protein